MEIRELSHLMVFDNKHRGRLAYVCYEKPRVIRCLSSRIIWQLLL